MQRTLTESGAESRSYLRLSVWGTHAGDDTRRSPTPCAVLWPRVLGQTSEGVNVANEPAYRRVADAIRAQIRSGELPAGSQLPALPELGEQYGLSATAARDAIATLRDEGHIEPRHGSGTYVRRFAPITRTSP